MNRVLRSLEVGDRAFGWVVLLAFITLIIHRPIMDKINDLTTPQPWFSSSFSIPDFRQGENPQITYSRKVNRPLTGHWSVRIFSPPGEDPYVCSGSGFAYFQPELSGVVPYDLWSFVGTECRPWPGDYRACSLYELTDHRDVTRSFGPFCDKFKVTE